MGARRVLIVSLHYAPERTGNAPYVADLARHLRSVGDQVTVLTTHPHYPGNRIHEGYGQWKRTETADGVRVVRLRHLMFRRVTAWRRLLAEISFGVRAAAVRWGRPDVILFVSPGLFSSAVVSWKARLLHPRTPRVAWVQDLYSVGLEETETASGRVRAAVGAIERDTLGQTSTVVVIHPRFAAFFDGSGADVRVVRNWGHLPSVEVGDRDAIRDSLGWSGTTVVLHAGNMGLKQGLDNAVAAARLLDRDELDARVVLLGDGNQRARLQSEGMGVRRLEFLDPVEGETEFFRTLKAADILLVNELPEVQSMSVPSKLTSYFATGLPVVAACAPGGVTSAEVHLAGAGVAVPAGDPEALVGAIMDLAHDPDRARALGAAGIEFRRQTLDRDLALAEFTALIQAVAP